MSNKHSSTQNKLSLLHDWMYVKDAVQHLRDISGENINKTRHLKTFVGNKY